MRLFEKRCDLLDGNDCAGAKASNRDKMDGHLSRLMIARLNLVRNDSEQKNIAHEGQQTRQERDISVDYYAERSEDDSFAEKANLYHSMRASKSSRCRKGAP